MTKPIYCSECGQKLFIVHKALKYYGRIIDLVNPHVCSDTPIELDLTPTEIPTKSDGKFVKKLNDLRPSQVNTADLRDRRKESDVKTSVPASILDQLAIRTNSAPKNPSNGDSDE